MDTIKTKLLDCRSLMDEGLYEKALDAAKGIVSGIPQDAEPLSIGASPPNLQPMLP